MGFSCCASDPIFWFAAPEILTLVLLLPHNVFLTKSRVNISNSCSDRGLTSILLLHSCAEDVHGKGRKIPLSICLLICSLTGGTLLQLISSCAVSSWSPGNKPKGLVCAPLSLEILKGAEDFVHPVPVSVQDLCPPGEFSLKQTPPLKSKAAEWQSQTRDHE